MSTDNADNSQKTETHVSSEDRISVEHSRCLIEEDNELTEDPNPRDAAAIKIQSLWRSHRAHLTLDSNARWHDAMIHARLKTGQIAAERGDNEPRARWRRAVAVAARLKEGEGLLMERDKLDKKFIEDKVPVEKVLETQHWLELIDGKHRYGSNLKFYHKRWQEMDTSDNFFRWLDYGSGKNLSLPECPRERLEFERITYLSAEQRLNYLVKIDNQGKLRWARNNELVDTTAGKWRDLKDGMGIAPLDNNGQFEPRVSHNRNSFDDPSNVEAAHYLGDNVPVNPVLRMFKGRFTVAGLTDRLLRKTVKRNTWIYVTDKEYNLFIGIKNSGTFQHSSFLAGGLVTSAGLIAVQDGIISSLSPLSGHYRTSIRHFREFVEILERQGAHLGRLKVSKAEIALWGIEQYKALKKAKGRWVKDAEVKAKRFVGKTLQHRPREGFQVGQWKREILHGRKPSQR